MSLRDQIFKLLQDRGPMTDDELMFELPLGTKRPSLRRSRSVLIKLDLVVPGPTKKQWMLRPEPMRIVTPEIRRFESN